MRYLHVLDIDDSTEGGLIPESLLHPQLVPCLGTVLVKLIQLEDRVAVQMAQVLFGSDVPVERVGRMDRDIGCGSIASAKFQDHLRTSRVVLESVRDGRGGGKTYE